MLYVQNALSVAMRYGVLHTYGLPGGWVGGFCAVSVRGAPFIARGLK